MTYLTVIGFSYILLAVLLGLGRGRADARIPLKFTMNHEVLCHGLIGIVHLGVEVWFHAFPTLLAILNAVLAISAQGDLTGLNMIP